MPISTKLVYGYTSVKVVINSCMTVKEIINELSLAAKPLFIANSSLALIFLGVLLIVLT